jgi:hypothetical protein
MPLRWSTTSIVSSPVTLMSFQQDISS